MGAGRVEARMEIAARWTSRPLLDVEVEGSCLVMCVQRCLICLWTRAAQNSRSEVRTIDDDAT